MWSLEDEMVDEIRRLLIIVNHCHCEATRQRVMSINIHTAINHKLPTPQLLVEESVIILLLQFINNIAKTFFQEWNKWVLYRKCMKPPKFWFQAFQHTAILFPLVYNYIFITNEARTKAGYRSRAYITWFHTSSAIYFRKFVKNCVI